jgi:hypothetical protein
MSRPIRLYRGDSMPRDEHSRASAAERGRTFANLFCGTGIVAKFADGGSSDLLEKRDVLALVLAHVGWERGTPEEKLMKHSPLISFSEREDVALRFVNPEELELEPCEFYEASYFTWRLELSLEGAGEPGRYAFDYEFDPGNVTALSSAAVQSGHRRVIEGAAISAIAMPLRDLVSQVSRFGHPKRYRAEIIDVVTFVNNQDLSRRDKDLVRRTVDLAGRDREWLVFPTDPGPEGLGYSSCLAMNRFLKVSRCFGLLKR